MKNRKHWKIDLGDDFWARFTYARPADDSLRLLGRVARGLQIGALAQTQEGRYVQANGDHLTPLPDAQIRQALDLLEEAASPSHATRSAMPERSVMVTIKRRRTAVIPDS